MKELTEQPVTQLPKDLHPNTANLVKRFAEALANKLRSAELKYGYSDRWASNDWMDECRAKLMQHIAKGDPLDVTAYCAFLWHHGERTASVAEQQGEQGSHLTPQEILASRLITAWVDTQGKQIPWDKAVEISATVTKMPESERQRLLALNDSSSAVLAELRAKVEGLPTFTGLSFATIQRAAVLAEIDKLGDKG